jgi:hypothetical protein
VVPVRRLIIVGVAAYAGWRAYRWLVAEIDRRAEEFIVDAFVGNWDEQWADANGYNPGGIGHSARFINFRQFKVGETGGEIISFPSGSTLRFNNPPEELT